MSTAQSVLSPVPAEGQGQDVQGTQLLTALAGKNIGFLNTFWPTYESLVDELGNLLRNRREVRATPRLDYWRRPRLNEVWTNGRDWLGQVDAVIVGLGA
ncbi:MAG: hypothetical protein HYY31_06140 [Chloroflexi bacterium]|nr:hypothetical protein [Chloroflexota bacterium]